MITALCAVFIGPMWLVCLITVIVSYKDPSNRKIKIEAFNLLLIYSFFAAFLIYFLK